MYREELLDHINRVAGSSVTYAVTWLGDSCIIVEGQRGIKNYSDEKITIKIDKKYILIHGENLTISDIHDRDVTITGDIHGVMLDD